MNRRLTSMLMIPLTLLILVVCTVRVEAGPSHDYPFAPDPKACTVTPRSVDSIVAAVGSPAEVVDQMESILPQGTRASAKISEAVTDTIVQLFACTNAGDFLRVYAFFSDRFLQQFFTGTPLTAEVIAYISAPPQPLPSDQLRIIASIGEVRLLDDERAVVDVVVDEPGAPRY